MIWSKILNWIKGESNKRIIKSPVNKKVKVKLRDTQKFLRKSLENYDGK